MIEIPRQETVDDIGMSKADIMVGGFSSINFVGGAEACRWCADKERSLAISDGLRY